MIALDTNVLVRYLVRDDQHQAEAARALLESLTIERPGYVCREVAVELVWVLERAYAFPRDRIATVLSDGPCCGEATWGASSVHLRSRGRAVRGRRTSATGTNQVKIERGSSNVHAARREKGGWLLRLDSNQQPSG